MEKEIRVSTKDIGEVLGRIKKVLLKLKEVKGINYEIGVTKENEEESTIKVNLT